MKIKLFDYNYSLLNLLGIAEQQPVYAKLKDNKRDWSILIEVNGKEVEFINLSYNRVIDEVEFTEMMVKVRDSEDFKLKVADILDKLTLSSLLNVIEGDVK